jgi:hypothetical protein
MAARTVTVGPSQTYASLHAALIGEDGLDLTVDNGSGVPGILYFDLYGFEDTTQVVYNGYTGIHTDASNYVVIRAVGSHGGKLNTSVYRHKYSGVNVGINIEDIPHLYLQGLQIISNGTTTNSRAMDIDLNYISNSKCYIDKLLMYQESSTSSYNGLYMTETNTDFYVTNSLIYGFKGNGIVHAAALGDVWTYNCTIDSCGTGIKTAGLKYRVKNTRITNCTTVVNETNGALESSSNNNLTDGSAPTNWGSNSLDSTDTPTVSYVDGDNATLASRDYHLVSGDSGIGAGLDLSSDSDHSFNDDIDGTTRSSWDIGADEYEALDQITRIVSETVGI